MQKHANFGIWCKNMKPGREMYKKVGRMKLQFNMGGIQLLHTDYNFHVILKLNFSLTSVEIDADWVDVSGFSF